MNSNKEPSLESWMQIPLIPRIREMVYTPWDSKGSSFEEALDRTYEEIRSLYKDE